MNKIELCNYIMKQIKNELPNCSKDTLSKVKDKLTIANEEDLERLCNAFNRFGVQNILEAKN